jgi:hypothetical protein
MPPLCILAAIPVGSVLGSGCDSDMMSNKNGKKDRPYRSMDNCGRKLIYLFILYVLLSTGFSTATVFGSHRPIEDVISEDIEDLTDDDEMVLCGDPIIALMAGRLQPPEATNIAEVRYPELTSEELITIVIGYDVRVVVISYQLSTYDQFYRWVHDNWDFQKAYGRPDRVYDEWKEPDEGIYLLYTIQ